jgi:hypothetical protein
MRTRSTSTRRDRNDIAVSDSGRCFEVRCSNKRRTPGSRTTQPDKDDAAAIGKPKRRAAATKKTEPVTGMRMPWRKKRYRVVGNRPVARESIDKSSIQSANAALKTAQIALCAHIVRRMDESTINASTQPSRRDHAKRRLHASRPKS